MIKTLKNRGRRGFTLVELLVVVLILAILTAIALPLYLNSVTNAQKRTCQANMQTIANAVVAEEVNTKYATTDTDLAGAPATTKEHDLLTVPTCPTNGTYTISFGTLHVPTVTCTDALHLPYTLGTSPS